MISLLIYGFGALGGLYVTTRTKSTQEGPSCSYSPELTRELRVRQKMDASVALRNKRLLYWMKT